MKIPQPIFDEIILRIKELSDKDFQRQVWLNIGNINKYESCFFDVYNGLVQDLPSEYLLNESPDDDRINKSFLTEFKLLLDLLKGYPDQNKTDKQIIDDPEWDKVVEQAKLVLRAYNEKNN
jgi:hypothetical protein